MTHYATCFNCAMDKATCQRRSALQKALVGSAVTSIKFRCPERKSFFAPGQRVSFDWSVWDSDGYEESRLPLVFHGTVVRERGSKFVVQVDAGKDASGEEIEAADVFKKNEALMIKVRPANMQAKAAKAAADAIGVTPHSDMRIFVEQAVKYALSAEARKAEALEREIAEKDAKIDRLCERLDIGPQGEDAIEVAESAMGHLRHRIETMKREIAELREVLKPFSSDDDQWPEELGDVPFNFDHIRRARTLLNGGSDAGN